MSCVALDGAKTVLAGGGERGLEQRLGAIGFGGNPLEDEVVHRRGQAEEGREQGVRVVESPCDLDRFMGARDSAGSIVTVRELGSKDGKQARSFGAVISADRVDVPRGRHHSTSSTAIAMRRCKRPTRLGIGFVVPTP